MSTFALVLYILTNVAHTIVTGNGVITTEGDHHLVVLRGNITEQACIDLLSKHQRVHPPVYDEGNEYALVGLACQEREEGGW